MIIVNQATINIVTYIWRLCSQKAMLYTRLTYLMILRHEMVGHHNLT